MSFCGATCPNQTPQPDRLDALLTAWFASFDLSAFSAVVGCAETAEVFKHCTP
jgi:hypothetical protein